MPTSKTAPLIEAFETGNIDYENLQEVHLDTSEFKGTASFPIDLSLARELAEIARTRKTTVRKLLESWIRQNLRKAKTA